MLNTMPPAGAFKGFVGCGPKSSTKVLPSAGSSKVRFFFTTKPTTYSFNQCTGPTNLVLLVITPAVSHFNFKIPRAHRISKFKA
jgi:hypothetical protein